ncbi:MAG: PAS domain S-box protein [Myxococcales bacterium]|nr:PAS domain S-box protein [Myxococcales bacterium]
MTVVQGLRLLSNAPVAQLEVLAQECARCEAFHDDVKKKLEALTSSSLDAVVMIDDDGLVVLWNRAAEVLFGFPAIEITGQKLSDFIVPERYRAQHDEGIARFKRTGGASLLGRTIELSALRKGGDEFPVEISYYASSVRLGSKGHAVALLRDITERKRAEAELKAAIAAQTEARTLLDAVMTHAPVHIMMIDADGVIRFINRVLAQYERDEVIGSQWLSYVAKHEHPMHQARLARVLRTGVAERYEVTTPGPDGALLWFSCQMVNMPGAGVLLVTQDVSDLKRTQAEAAGAQKLASIGTLAAGVAHEINTPVQFVGDSVHFLGGATRDLLALIEAHRDVRRLVEAGAPPEVLEAAATRARLAEEEADLEYLDQNLPKAVERCSEGLGRVRDIVQSLREFAAPPSDVMAPVDLNHAIRNALTLAASEWRAHAVVATRLGELPPVVCFVADVSQVVLSLVVNAAHAIADVVRGTDAKGTITVETRCDGSDVVISVADTGTGIPEAIRDRIFDPFFTTREVGQGAGQGLSNAWTVVTQKHGGQIGFETCVGKGTTFSVRLPVAGKPGG